MTVIKICGLLLICLCSVLILKQMKAEFAFMPALAALIVSFVFILNGSSSNIVATVKGFAEESDIGGYIVILLKALGISYLTVITADICRSAGEELLADIAQTAGKFEILALSLPLAVKIVDMAKEIL